jgi:hypothetical protein
MALVYPSISRSLHSNGTTCYIASSIRLFILNGLQEYRHFFLSEGCTCNICAWSYVPTQGLVCPVFTLQLCLVSPSSPWLDLHGVCFPTSPTARSLRPFILSGSLKRCEPVQVYHHHPSFHIMTHHNRMQTIKILLSDDEAKLSRVAGVPTSLALNLCAVSSFILEAANPSIMSQHSFSEY